MRLTVIVVSFWADGCDRSSGCSDTGDVYSTITLGTFNPGQFSGILGGSRNATVSFGNTIDAQSLGWCGDGCGVETCGARRSRCRRFW